MSTLLTGCICPLGAYLTGPGLYTTVGALRAASRPESTLKIWPEAGYSAASRR